MMTNEELISLVDELRALPKENEWVEFKKNVAPQNFHDKLGQYISALSNATCINHQPFGYLIFGIDDQTHGVVGTSFKFKNRKEGNEELELWMRRMLYPSVQFQHFICQYNSLHVEIFKISAARSEPTNFKKIPYIRFNSSLTDLRNFPDYIRAIYNAQEDWSAKIIETATIDDLDTSAISKAREKFKEKQAGTTLFEEIDKWDNVTFLDKTKITIGGKITSTAIILLGKPESVHFISPAVAQVTWKLDTDEKAYRHFEIPLFLSINDVLLQIRNVKYKFFPDNQLISVEVNKYDTKVILEALNNCIAHQDYNRNARILLTEQTNKLIFENEGGFIDGSPDDYSLGTKTPQIYRNRWLANAMVSLNMIDTMGYGIHRMYEKQIERYFPLPDYSQTTRDKVTLEIYGHSLDENYSKLLIEKKDDLSLIEVILLDKVQKKESITEEAAKLLKKKMLIEGRKGHYYISAEVAAVTNQKIDYTRNKGLEKQYYKEFILQHIQNHKSATREEIDKLLWDKLPDYMSEKQKKIKINNILSEMSENTIQNAGSRTKPKWTLLQISNLTDRKSLK